MKKLSAYETHKSVKETSFYTLDSIFFFWTTLSTNSSMDQGSYAILCADNNVDAISFAQRGALLNYLNGKEKSCIYFDTSVPFRYVKPQFASSLTSGTEEKKETADAAQVVNSIQYYKRMRSILGNEKIYETRSKVINLNGKTKFKEAIGLIRREVVAPVSHHGEDWKDRMNVDVGNINLDEGFLTRDGDNVDESYANEAIIIVAPAAGNNVITMYNVKKFMEEGIYVPSDVIRNTTPLKPQKIVMSRVINGRKMLFRFIDNPLQLNQAEWSHVVCVMAGNQSWQFKGWRYSNPAVLFSRVQGVFIWFSEMEIPPMIKGLSVKLITINRDVRNMDDIARVQFWDMIEKEIKTKKTMLLK